MDKKLAAENKLAAYRFKNKLKSSDLKNDLNKILKEHYNEIFTEKNLSSFLKETYYVLYNSKLSSEELNTFKDTMISWGLLDYFCFNNKEILYCISCNSNSLLNVLSRKY